MAAAVFFGVVTIALWAAIAGVPAAVATPNNEVNGARLDKTVEFLQQTQNPDGGFGGSQGSPSDLDFSAWVSLALAAAGINPRDQYKGDGPDVYSYLVEHAGELSLTTDFERALLVVDASGTSPEDFGGVDLVRQILSRQLTATAGAGAFAHQAGERAPGVNDTIFAILALSPLHEPTVVSAIEHAVSWLLGEQDLDGGWNSVCPKTAAGCSEDAEVDMTGAAMQALSAAGLHGTEAQRKAGEFLREAQDPDGGFPEFPRQGEESNVASTAWAVQAIWAAGENPEGWLGSPGREPLDYLQSLQHEDGSIQWKASSDANPVWMTAYVGPALAGDPWPIPAPPYVERAPAPPLATGGLVSPSAAGDGSGGGGQAATPGSGVVAGGGGLGAPLFSRPQPESKGHTPGGARLLGHERASGVTKRRRNPGRPRRETAPTITAAGAGRASAGTDTARRAGNTSARSTQGRSAEEGSVVAPALTGAARREMSRGAREVKGVLIGAPSGTQTQPLQPGAPGLHSAGAGGNQGPGLANGIGAAAGLLVCAGSLLERRRPQRVL